jgi:phosphatidylglycerophosphate synthase
MVRSVETGPVTGLIAALVLLGALAGTVGLGGQGWIVGVACGVMTYATLTAGMARYGVHRLGPADRVTLTRATLTGGAAALTADSFSRPVSVGMLVTLAVVALILDAVDGWLARRTRTASTLGARFDMEADAFLILVLTVYVASSTGAWVLAIGLARYAMLVAGWLLPWLRRPVPRRYWRKVVAATMGVVLTCAAANVLPRMLSDAALAASLALLTESFGRDTWWLWTRHLAAVPARDDERLGVPATSLTARRPRRVETRPKQRQRAAWRQSHRPLFGEHEHRSAGVEACDV